MKFVLSAICVLLMVLAFALPAQAQLGSITGKVFDKEGKAVSGATVLIERDEVKYRVEVKTDRGGIYSRLGMEDGTYRVTVSQDGATVASANVTVSLGARTEKDFDLRSAGQPAAAAAPPLSRAQREAEQRANSETQGIFNTGLAALTAKNYDEAIKQFLLAAEKRPLPAVYNQLGESYTLARKYNEATDAYKKATELKADEADYFYNLGLAATRSSQFDIARNAVQKAVDLDSSRGGLAFLNFGMLLSEKAQDKEAIDAFQKSLKANPKLVEVYYELGMLYMRNTATMKDAVTQFERYIQAAPKGDPKAATARQLADAAKASIK